MEAAASKKGQTKSAFLGSDAAARASSAIRSKHRAFTYLVMFTKFGLPGIFVLFSVVYFAVGVGISGVGITDEEDLNLEGATVLMF